jgi:hypothetical protein
MIFSDEFEELFIFPLLEHPRALFALIDSCIHFAHDIANLKLGGTLLFLVFFHFLGKRRRLRLMATIIFC